MCDRVGRELEARCSDGEIWLGEAALKAFCLCLAGLGQSYLAFAAPLFAPEFSLELINEELADM